VGGAHSTYGRDKKCIQYFGWKPEGRTQLGRPRHTWEDNIRQDLRVGGIIWFRIGTIGGPSRMQ